MILSEPWLVLAILAAALAIDWILGDPQWLYRIVPHPVVAIGNGIGVLDRMLNHGRGRRVKGTAALILVCGMPAALGVALHVLMAATSDPFHIIVEGAVVSVFLAQRGLYDHVRAVATGLERDGLAGGLTGGRAAVAHLVGRDPDSLDEPAVCRAAIESLAENFGDGVIAPVFWYVLFGLPGIVAYKAINTADSMIGHKTDRHIDFGWAAARFDDLVNWLPARLTGALLALAALVKPGATTRGAWTAMRRDARRHTSPNAGWPEAAMAGALTIALAGPRRYGDRTVDGAWMGRGRTRLDANDVRRALALFATACVLMLISALAVAVLRYASV